MSDSVETNRVQMDLNAKNQDASSEAKALIRVHKLDAVPEQTFWIAHSVFLALAVVGAAFIVFARGPRRRDALVTGVNENSAAEGKE